MTVSLSAQHLDVSIHLGNILKTLRNLGCNKKAGNYGCDGRVAFDLWFGELLNYLMTLECGPQNSGGLVQSGITQLIPTQNMGPIQVIKKMTHMVR